ncbi:MAG: NAD-dependent epimerase/dehydratase family protein [Planctomycetota bacterium]|nr:NAD-dependent epimerase/dehydratase family protein [Planctomycetota bacterium]
MSADLENAYQGRRVCVTGGAGFIGSHLVAALVKFGAEVSVIDDLTAGSSQNLPTAPGRVRLVQGSILDSQALAEAVDGAELIFHLAALTSVPGSVEQPDHYHQVNATGTMQVLEAARAAGTKRVIYASSSSIYGDRGRGPVVETMTPQPTSPYAAAKGAGELMLRAFAHCHGLSCISLRYFNIFGPRQRPDSPYAAVIPRFAEALLKGEKPTIYGDGTQTRDFTHVANAVQANLLAGASTKPLHGEAVNIACGTSCSLLQLIEMMAQILGVEPSYELGPSRVGEVMHSRASIEAAARLLGYKPVVELKDGLKEALEYYAAG